MPLATLALMVTVSQPCFFPPHSAGRIRPVAWARPIDVPGLENTHRLDDGVFRGAQPTADGVRSLGEMGVRAIISLRTSEGDEGLAPELPVRCVRIPINLFGAGISDREVVEFLVAVMRPEHRPAFVHCKYGADRTGAMCAVYRIVVQGWSKRDAIEEMTQGGFGFHGIWQSLIDYIEQMDVEAIRKAAGVPTPKSMPAFEQPVEATIHPATNQPTSRPAIEPAQTESPVLASAGGAGRRP